VEKYSQTDLLHFCQFHKAVQSKQVRNRRKFSLSGHPGLIRHKEAHALKKRHLLNPGGSMLGSQFLAKMEIFIKNMFSILLPVCTYAQTYLKRNNIVF
jgi:hypothetical protein